MAQPQINLDSLNDQDLQKLRSEILAKVAERLKVDPGADVMYDRHGSGHSNSTSVLREMDVLTNPAVARLSKNTKTIGKIATKRK